MSLLSPEIHAALAHLLQGLSRPDNNARSAAEEQLNTDWVAARPDVLLMGLVEHIQASGEVSVSRLNSIRSGAAMQAFNPDLQLSAFRQNPLRLYCSAA